MPSRASLWCNCCGATAVEFALIAPILFLLLFGAMETGRLLFVQAALQHAVADAARCASINPETCSSPRALALEIEAEMAALSAPMPVAPEALMVKSAPCGLSIAATLPYRPLLLTIAKARTTVSARACART